MRRREFLLTTAGLALGGVSGVVGDRYLSTHAKSAVAATNPVSLIPPNRLTAREAIDKLVAGNRRFVDGHMAHQHENSEWRAAIAEGQHPFAAVLGCSDSRVPPEIVFDEGLGDLFVIRDAGNVADDDTLGSLEYAVEHLHVPLIVVLGHEGCGAVTAAVNAIVKGEAVEGHVLRLVDDIAPAVWQVKDRGGDLVDHAVHANVALVVQKLRLCGPILRTHEQKGDVTIVGACYNLHTGVVDWPEV
jgi:carbonic anhydrase